jgi:hypothetical protein
MSSSNVRGRIQNKLRKLIAPIGRLVSEAIAAAGRALRPAPMLVPIRIPCVSRGGSVRAVEFRKP